MCVVSFVVVCFDIFLFLLFMDLGSSKVQAAVAAPSLAESADRLSYLVAPAAAPLAREREGEREGCGGET